jgi:uncharacterized protein YjdB
MLNKKNQPINQLTQIIMNKNKKIRLLAVALMTGAVALGTQSCSNDEGETGDVAVTGITVTPETKTLLVGGTDTLEAAVFPAKADQSVTWTSSATSIATVDANGVVKAIAIGTATITATSVANTGKEATCAITVSESYSVSLPTSRTILANATDTLTAEIIPSPATPMAITWTSSNTEVATVAGGVVTGVTAGTATITAALTDNPDTKAECTVTIVELSSVPANEQLVGWWTFENETALEKAIVGEDLEAKGEGGTFTSIEGPDGTKGVAVGDEAYYAIHHNIGANGGGEYTNEYTLMMDIRGTAAGFEGWLSVFESNGGGLLWIDEAGRIGYDSFGGYSTATLTPDTWHRVVIAAKLGESFNVYIDGTLVWTASADTGVDGGLSLRVDEVYIGYDVSGYPGPDFAEVRMWGVQLTDEQVATLGAAVAP